MNGVLETILGSKLRVKVLGWIFTHPDERYFVRQLTGLLGEDSTNVSRELARLEKAGILIVTVSGRQKYYQANKESPIYNELHGLIVKTVGVVDVLRLSMETSSGKIKAAFVFGSIASGNENRDSDIDVMLVGAISFGDIVNLLSTAEERLGREINTVVYSVLEFRRKLKEDHHFVSNVITREKLFIIGDEHELAELVG